MGVPMERRLRRADSFVQHLAQHGVAHRPVGQAVERGDHRHLDRIPGERAASVRAQGGQAALEPLNELAVKTQFDRAGTREGAVGLAARDEDSVDVSLPSPANAGQRESLPAAQLVLHPRRAPASRDVGRGEANGDDAFQAQRLDARDELLASVDHHTCRCPPGGSVEGQLLEQRSAVQVWQLAGRAAIQVQDVEHLKDCRGEGATAGEAGAKPGEIRAAIRPQAHELAVENHPTLAELAGDIGQFGKVL